MTTTYYITATHITATGSETPEQQLSAALTAIAGGTGDYVIQLGTADAPISVDLTSDLPIIALGSGGTLTIDGNNSTIDGENHYRGLLAYSGSTTIDNLNFLDTAAIGGNGGNSAGGSGTGGGGAGLGGGLFVASGASVAISNVNFDGTSAIGGNGGTNEFNQNAGGGGGGGGGMGGNGGLSTVVGGDNAGTGNSFGASGGGGGGGGLGVGASGGGVGSHLTDGADGIADGQSGAGDGGSESIIADYLVVQDNYNFSGSKGGTDGGGGGAGLAVGGGGGGIGGVAAGNYNLGQYGLELSFNPITFLQTLIKLVDPEAALAFGLANDLEQYLVDKYENVNIKNSVTINLTGDPSVGPPPSSKFDGLKSEVLPVKGLSISLIDTGPQGSPNPGGAGGFGGGGGGGGSDSSGGAGGFGGGGGGVTNRAGLGSYGLYGGNGGFGGGAGGGAGILSGPDAGFWGGSPGFGGGSSYFGYGGGGLGAGGAMFVQQGGTLTDLGGGTIRNTKVQGGAEAIQTYGTGGYAVGSGIFLQGMSTLHLAPLGGQVVSIGNIADEAGTPNDTGVYAYDFLVNGVNPFAGSVDIGGAGKVVLTGTNTYLGGTYLAAGSTLEIAKGTTLYGTIYAPAQGEANLILDSGVKLRNPIQLSTNGTLLIDESNGGQFSGSYVGLVNGRVGGVAVIGAPDNTAPIEADANGFAVYTQGYISATGAPTTAAAGGTLVSEPYLMQSGATTFYVGSGAQLQSLLTWIPSFPLYYASAPAVTILLDGQIGSSFDASSILIPTLNPYLVGQAGGAFFRDRSIILSNNGGETADGQIDPLHASVTLSGGTITLNPLTSLVFSGVLVVDDTINGSAGTGSFNYGTGPGNGLATEGTITLGANNTFKGGVEIVRGTLELTNANAAGTGTITFAPNSNSTLKIDGTVLPTNAIAGILNSDKIDLTAFANPLALYLADASGNLTIGGKVLHFTGIAPNSFFLGSADGQGGTDLTVLGGAAPAALAIDPAPVIAYLNAIAAAVPNAQYSFAFDASSDTLSLTTPQGTVTAQPGQSTNVTISGTVDLPASIPAGLGEIEFAPTTGGTPGATFNLNAVGQTLVIGGTLLPTMTIADFQYGDTIDLTGIADYSPLRISGDNDTLVVDGQTLQFASDVPADSFYLLKSDGNGGTDITPIGFSGNVATQTDLDNDTAFVNGLTASELPNGEFKLTLDAPSGTLDLSSPLTAVDTEPGIELQLIGNGQTIAGGGSTGLVLSGGQLDLENLTLSGFSGPGLIVQAGTTAYLDSVTDAEGVSVAASGTLVFRSGQLGTVSGSGAIDAAPVAGKTATLTGAITGDLGIVDPYAQSDLGATTSLGTVVLASGASVAGAVNLETSSTLVVQSGATVSGGLNITSNSTVELQSGELVSGTIEFDSTFGATLRIDGTSLPSNTIDFADDFGAISLPGLSVSSPTDLTLASNDTLQVPGTTGTLHFSGDVAPGETFVLTPDGQGAPLLLPEQENTTISTGAEFDTLVPLLDALPGNAGLSLSVALTDNVLLQADAPLLQLNPGVALSFSDAAGDTGGFTLAAGVSASLTGTNSFSGGVTLMSGSTLQVYSAKAAGSAGITFDGTGATLVLENTGLAAPINGFEPTDSIDLVGVTPPADSNLFVDANSDLTIPSASGAVTLQMPDQVPGSLFSATSDGHGGTLLTEASGRETFTAHDEADLNNDIALANAAHLNTEIVLAYSADSATTLADALSSVNLQSGQALFIEGVSVQPAGVNGVTFFGTGANLILNPSLGSIGPITGVEPSDHIDLSGVTPPAHGTLYVDANSDLTIPSASGAITLQMPDQVPGSVFTATSDGNGGTLVTDVLGRQTLTAHNEAELDAYITTANSSSLNTEIVLDFGSSNEITLTQALTKIDMKAGVALFINGNGEVIDGANSYGGFVVESGRVGFGDMAIENAVEQGGTGQSGEQGAGGGAGLGGGLFVGGGATVGLYGVTLSGNAAKGGAGGAGAYAPAPETVSGGLGNVTGGAPGSFGNGGSTGLGAGARYGFDGYGGVGDETFGVYNPTTGTFPIGGFGGDGGLGAGGSIFVAPGGQLTIGGTLSELGGSATGGAGGASPFQDPPKYLGNTPGVADVGGALGSGLFSNGSVDITLSPALGQTQTYADAVAGGIGFDITGAGTVEFDGALSYSGQTTIESGSLVITGDMSGMTGAIVDNSTLRLEQSSGTTVHGLVSGTGSLIDATGGTLTLASGLSLSGGVTVQSGELRVGGGVLSGPNENDATLDIATSGTVTDSGVISGTGNVVFDGTGTTTLAGNNTDAGTLTVDSGTLVLSGTNSFANVVLNGGDLVLGENGTTGSGTVDFAAGVLSTLTVSAADAGANVIGGFAPGDTIHLLGLANPQSVTANGDTLTVTGKSGNIQTSVNIQLSADTDTSNAIYTVASDGHGGTDLVQRASAYVVNDETDLQNAIAAIGPGGAAYEAGIAYEITFGSGISLTSALPAISLAPGATLLIDGDVALSDPTASHSSNGDQAAANAYELTIASPGVTIEGGQNPVDLFGVGLDVAAGAWLEIDAPDVEIGQDSQIGTIVDGSLTINGGGTLSALDNQPGVASHGALTGTGDLTLENGNFTIGDASEAFTFSGTLALKSATLDVPGYSQFNQLSLNELDLYGNSTAEIDASGVSKIVFEAGATATLWTDTPTISATIYGLAAGDKIRNDSFYPSGNSVSLGTNNVLTVLSPAGTFQYQLDPTQNLSNLAFSIVGQTIVVSSADFTVSTEAQLDAAIKAIDAGGAGNHYTITLAANFTGANALQNNLANITLPAGALGFSNPTTLTIDGNGYTIDGNGHGIFDSNINITLNDVTLQDAGSGAFHGALDVTNGAAATLNDVTLAGGVNGNAFLAAPAAGQETVISGNVTAGSFVLNGPGTLDLGGNNSFTGGLTIDQGTLELGQAHSAGAGLPAHNTSYYGTGSAIVTFAGDGTILVDGAIPDIVVEGMNSSTGVIDLAGYAPSTVTVTQGRLYHNGGFSQYTDVTASGDGGNLYLDGVTAPLVVISDGKGGSLVYIARTQLTATDSASLQSAINAFNAGGDEAAVNVADTITLSPPSGTIDLASALPAIALPSGTSLTVQGNNSVIDGGGQGGLSVAAGSLNLQNLTLTDFAANSSDVVLSAGTSATLTNVTLDATSGGSALTLAAGASASLHNVTLAASGGATPLVSVGAGDTLSIVGGSSNGGTIELQDGAVLDLASSGTTPLEFNAAIDDPAGDGTGGGEGSVQISGDVTLNAVSDFLGGTTVDGMLELATTAAAGYGAITIAKGGTLEIANSVLVGNAISGLANGGRIDLLGFVPTSESFSGDFLTLSNGSGSISLDLADSGDITESFADALSLTSDNAGGTLIGYTPRSLATGTVSATSLSLGNVHLGTLANSSVGTPTATVTVTNTAPAGSETLKGQFGAFSAGLFSTGSVSLAPGQSGSLELGMLPNGDGSEGVYNGTASLDLTSNATGLTPAPVSVPSIAVTATYYSYATPSVTMSVNLGMARVGDAALTGDIVVADGTTVDPYREGLIYAFNDPKDPNLSASNASGTIAAGQSANIGLSLATNAGGYINDSAVVSAISTGVGTSGLGDTSLGGQTVTLTGTIYNKAVAEMPSTLSFGYVHVGSGYDSQQLTIINGAPVGTASDQLVAQFDGAQGTSSQQFITLDGISLTGQGGSVDVAAGTSAGLTVDLLTTATGVFSTTATVDFTSHDSALADVALPSQTVTLTGTVINYASAGVALQSGSAGTLTSTDATHYTLNFGDIDSTETADLSVLNTATGLADVLSGHFTVTGGGADFQNAGIDRFSGITAGSADNAPAITITTGVGGDVSETLVLTPTGSNAGGYVGNLAPITLTVTGHVTTTSFTATTEADLNTYIALINQGGVDARSGENYTITLAPLTGTTIDVVADLAAINLASGSSLDIVGNGTTLAVEGSARGFVVQSGGLTLDDVNFSGFTAPTSGTDASGNGADVAVENGGSLTVLSGTFGAGTAGTSSLYVENGSTLSFKPVVGTAIEVTGGIDSDAAGAVDLAGAGTLKLDAAGSYSGGTRVAGTLELGTMNAAGSGTISLQQGSTLQLDATGTLQPIVAGFAGATIDATAVQGGTVTLVGNQLTIANATTSVVVDLADANLSYYGLTVGADAAGGTTVSEAAPGFAPEAMATAVIGSAVFGNVHVGDTDSATFTISNPLLQGGDWLVGSPHLVAEPLTASGSIDLAPGQSGTLELSFTPTGPGGFNDSIPILLESEGPGGVLTPLSDTSVQVSGNIYALAAPSVSQVGNLGVTRLGDGLTGDLFISNIADSIDQEKLLYIVSTEVAGTTPESSLGDLAISGASSGTVASGNTATLGLTLTASQAGVDTFVLPVNLTSTGVGTSGLANTTLAAQQTYVTGTFYEPAVAQYTQAIDFGWLHSGQSASGSVIVSNVAVSSSNYQDTLGASWNSIGNGFTGTGSLSGLTDNGAAGYLGVTFQASSAGTFADNATLNLASQDAALADLDTVSGPIALSATVTNYAALSLQELSGGGSLSGYGTTDGLGAGVTPGQYTLNLGDISGNGPQDFTFDVLNAASGFTDQLSGSVESMGGSIPLSLTGDGLNFSGLSAGQSSSAFTIEIDPSQAGTFTDTVVLHGTGSNAGGYSNSLYDTTLTITGTVDTGTYTFPDYVENENDLNNDLVAIKNGDAGGYGQGIVGLAYVINFDPSNPMIGLNQALTPIDLPAGASLTINGNNARIDAQNLYAGFGDYISSGNVTLNDLTIENAGGGDFFSAGGLVIGPQGNVQYAGAQPGNPTVTLNNVGFIGDSSGGSSSFADDMTVNSGAIVTVNDGYFGASTSPSPAGALNVAGGAEVDFVTTTGFDTQVVGALAGSGLVQIEGTGSVSIDDIAPQRFSPGAAQSFSGTYEVASGATLNLNYDPTQTNTTIVDSGSVVFNAPQGAPNSSLQIQGYQPSLLPTDVVELDYQVADPNATNGYDQGTILIPVETYSLRTFVDYFNVYAQGLVTASIDANNPAQIDLTAGSTPYLSVTLTDASGKPLEEMGLSSGIIDYADDPTQPFASGSQTQVFQNGDAILLNGTEIELGPSNGYSTLGDLLALLESPYVQGGNGIQGIAPGLTVTSDGLGDLSLSSTTEFTLADLSGTPLEDAGLAPGTYGGMSYSGDISGSGDVVINQTPVNNLVISGTAAWTGTTEVTEGTLTFTGDTSHLTGTIDLAKFGANVVFDEAAPDTFSGDITGNGNVDISGSGTLTLAGSIDESYSGPAIVLDGGTANIVSNDAEGNGPIQFAPGISSTLEIGQGVTLASGISGFTTGDRLDLAGFDAATTQLQVAADGSTLTVSDANGDTTSIATNSYLPSTLMEVTGDGAGGVLLTALANSSSISGFVPHGQLDLPEIAYDPNGSANLLANSELQINSDGNAYDLALNPSGPWQYFHLQEDTFGTTLVTSDDTPCYCRGTLIATDHGQTEVEKLEIGDRVMTASGVARPIKWIGRRSYGGRFVMGRTDILPICIKAGALEDNVPQRDLWISPHHAMYLEGVLIEAKDLINGVSIAQTERVEKVEYFHVELETHDVIIAEGALSESFLDDNSRGMFHNAREYRSLYPDLAALAPQYCAPRLDHGYEVEAARQRIALRAGLIDADAQTVGALRGYVDRVSADGVAGWAQNIDHPEAPVCLDIFAGGQLIGQALANRYRGDLKTAGLGSGHHSFEFTPPVSLAFAPDAVEVRRSLDGVVLKLSAAAQRQTAVFSDKPKSQCAAAVTRYPSIQIHRRAPIGRRA